jgi:hypothetical protein
MACHPAHHQGYSSHAFGSLLFYIFILLTLTWPAIFVWIDYEYYVSYAAFFSGSYRQLDIMLICCWHTSVLWFPFAKIMSPMLGNYYSQRVPLSKCAKVAVWQHADDQILLEDNSNATQLVRSINKLVRTHAFLHVNPHLSFHPHTRTHRCRTSADAKPDWGAWLHNDQQSLYQFRQHALLRLSLRTSLFRGRQHGGRRRELQIRRQHSLQRQHRATEPPFGSGLGHGL